MPKIFGAQSAERAETAAPSGLNDAGKDARDLRRAMKTWLNPKIVVRDSPIEGRGLFAARPIAAGEQLIVLGDEGWIVMSDDQFQAFIETAGSYDAVALGNGMHRVSTRSRDEEPSNYGNHSCAPNAHPNDDGLVAAHDIAAGTEITSDYAPMSAPTWSMRCNCGSAACRGIVRGVRS
jgi:hypothetical protein